MKQTSRPQYGLSILIFLCLHAFAAAAGAAVGVREAAVGLERQLQGGGIASQHFRLPLSGSAVVLTGEAQLKAVEHNLCRRTLELVHDQPFERRGLRITSLSRRSVQDGPCHNFADAMVAQATAVATSIAEQIGVETVGVDGAPAARVLVAQVDGATPVRLNEVAPAPGAVVALTVLEKAIIRDAPNKLGEKLSRADKGTRLKAQRITGNPDWFVLDGGLRFISASVVDVSDAATPTAPARGDTSRVRLKIKERAVLRNAPSFHGKKVASLAAGVERLAHKVPGMKGWFELADTQSRYPLYIHESVVAEKLSDKHL